MRFWILLFAVLLAAHLCHTGILWPEESLPLAAAVQLLHGKALYRDAWFDKPPLLAWTYLLWGASAGWLLRAAGALYCLLACWIAGRFARDVWGPREARLAAGLLAFFLVFYLPSAVIPLAADLLMIVPHLAAVWLAWRGRAFWAGAVAGLAFLVNPKGLFVLAAAAVFAPSPTVVLGFLIPCAAAGAVLFAQGAFDPYFEQVWRWGRIYAAATFVADPVRNALLRTLAWMGFHACIVAGPGWTAVREKPWRWIAWLGISVIAVAMGWRFFPRYYFQLLPPVVLLASRGLVLMGRRRAFAAAALLLVPLIRFSPRYALLARDLVAARPHQWADLAMDDDSRQVSAHLARLAHPGDTLLVWGFRPEIYAYTRLAAGTRFLDSQPLTGVPADRHLTDARAVTPLLARANRAEVARSRPTFIVDGLGPFNPRLAITAYPDLAAWLDHYRPVARTRTSVVYKRFEAEGPVYAATPPGADGGVCAPGRARPSPAFPGTPRSSP